MRLKMRSKKRRLTTLAGGLTALAVTTLGFTASAGAAHADSSTQDFLVTLYGRPDNSPPGDAVAYPENGGYPTIHDVASGTGTYADPITYATDQDELLVGTIVYYPYLHFGTSSWRTTAPSATRTGTARALTADPGSPKSTCGSAARTATPTTSSTARTT